MKNYFWIICALCAALACTKAEQTPEPGTQSVPVSGISLDATDLILEMGQVVTLTATITPENASNKNIIWSSSKPEVASVENGTITALAIGETYIFAKSEDGQKSAECKVTVKAETIRVTGVELDNNSIDLVISKGSQQLTATVVPDNADNKAVTWTSLNPSLVTVNNGELNAVGESGSTKVIVETIDGGFKDTCEVNVLFPTPEETIICNEDNDAVEDTIYMALGETRMLNVQLLPNILPQDEWDWSYDLNQDVLSIDIGTNSFKAVKEGVVVLTAEPYTSDSSTKIDQVVIIVFDPTFKITCGIESLWSGQYIALNASAPVKEWSVARLEGSEETAVLETYISTTDGYLYAGAYKNASGAIADSKVVLTATSVDDLIAKDTLTIKSWRPRLMWSESQEIEKGQADMGVGSLVRFDIVDADNTVIPIETQGQIFSLEYTAEALTITPASSNQFYGLKTHDSALSNYAIKFNTANDDYTPIFDVKDYMFLVQAIKYNGTSLTETMAGTMVELTSNGTIKSIEAILPEGVSEKNYFTQEIPHSQKTYVGLGFQYNEQGAPCDADIQLKITSSKYKTAYVWIKSLAIIPEVYAITNAQTQNEQLTLLSTNSEGSYEVSSGDYIAIKVKYLDGTYISWPGTSFDILRGDPERTEKGWIYEDDYSNYSLFQCKSPEDFDYQSTKDYEIRITNNSGTDYNIPLSFSVML